MPAISAQNIYGASPVNLQCMDVETALMCVQSQRRELLEGQLRQQLAGVAEKNAAMAQANEQINSRRNDINTMETENISLSADLQELNKMKEQLQTVLGRNDDGWTGLSWGWDKDNAASSHAMLERVKAMGLSGAEAARDIDRNGTMDAHASTLEGWISQIDTKISQANQRIESNTANISTAKADIDNLKSSIDALANSQQMEMLRLQSLSNKCNEAADIMTNFMKKMQDNRSSIISNMR